MSFATDEIREALMFLDRLPEEKRNEVRVEVYEYNKESSVKVSFRLLQELEEYLESRFRTLLLKGRGKQFGRIWHLD